MNMATTTTSLPSPPLSSSSLLVPVCVGIDLGGSHITSILLTEKGDIIDSTTTNITDRSTSNVLNIISNITNDLISKNSTTCYCIGIGLGIPGNVDPTTSTTRYLPNFGWYDTVDIGSHLKATITTTNITNITMRNDGRCHAIAEVKYGAGVNSKILAMVTLGTGIGGALVINGRLFDGSTYDAGDFGHHVIHNGGSLAFDCVCGKKGCFEYHASADGLVRHYNKLNGSLNINNAHDFIINLRQSPNDSLLIQAFNDYRNDLSTGLANLVTFYNPDTIIIGGGLSQAPELFDGLIDLIDEKTLPATKGNVKILPAKLANNAGAIGAALVAFQSYHDSINTSNTTSN